MGSSHTSKFFITSLNSSKYKYSDDKSDVPFGTCIEDEGKYKKKYAITYDADGQITSRREIKTKIAIKQSRLRYLDDKSNVPEDVQIIEEGTGKSKRKYAVTYDEQGNVTSKREVKTKIAIKLSSLRYLDDKSEVPEDVQIIEEGAGKSKRKYAVTYDEQGNVTSKRGVKPIGAIRKNRLSYVDDQSNVTENSSVNTLNSPNTLVGVINPCIDSLDQIISLPVWFLANVNQHPITLPQQDVLENQEVSLETEAKQPKLSEVQQESETDINFNIDDINIDELFNFDPVANLPEFYVDQTITSDKDNYLHQENVNVKETVVNVETANNVDGEINENNEFSTAKKRKVEHVMFPNDVRSPLIDSQTNNVELPRPPISSSNIKRHINFLKSVSSKDAFANILETFPEILQLLRYDTPQYLKNFKIECIDDKNMTMFFANGLKICVKLELMDRLLRDNICFIRLLNDDRHGSELAKAIGKFLWHFATKVVIDEKDNNFLNYLVSIMHSTAVLDIVHNQLSRKICKARKRQSVMLNFERIHQIEALISKKLSDNLMQTPSTMATQLNVVNTPTSPTSSPFGLFSPKQTTGLATCVSQLQSVSTQDEFERIWKSNSLILPCLRGVMVSVNSKTEFPPVDLTIVVEILKQMMRLKISPGIVQELLKDNQKLINRLNVPDVLATTLIVNYCLNKIHDMNGVSFIQCFMNTISNDELLMGIMEKCSKMLTDQVTDKQQLTALHLVQAMTNRRLNAHKSEGSYSHRSKG